MGEQIRPFSFPICKAFKPSVLYGQLCYEFDPSTLKTNLTAQNPFLLLILDYNEDKQYNTILVEGKIKNEETLRFSEIIRNVEKANEAIIYIHTLGR